MTDSQSEDTMIAALLREREGLVVRGLKDRVAQVDKQLQLRGHKPTTGKATAQTNDEGTSEAADEAARQEPPKSAKTSGPRQQTRTAD